MGGINCPPPVSRPDAVPSRVRAAYADRLAEYSEALFAGASDFFGANRDIEAAITAHANEIPNPVIELLARASRSFQDSAHRLAGLASLLEEMDPGAPNAHNIAAQEEHLICASTSCSRLHQRLKSIATASDLQTALWSSPSVRSAFLDAARAVLDVVGWQVHFAKADMATRVVAIA